MCLILFAINPNERFRLVVAANRDEYYGRTSQAAHFWAESPDLLAGRDEEMGGTWLGITRTGRFAAVTNFREDPAHPLPNRSRGELPCQYLTGEATPEEFVRQVARRGDEYRGFNLLVADGKDCYYQSNRAGLAKKLAAGCYGISNQQLDCSWPKVVQGRQRLAALLAKKSTEADLRDELFRLLSDPGDGTDFSTSNFISGQEYGTRAETVLLVSVDGRVQFEERSFGPLGKPLGTTGKVTNKYQFNL